MPPKLKRLTLISATPKYDSALVALCLSTFHFSIVMLRIKQFEDIVLFFYVPINLMV